MTRIRFYSSPLFVERVWTWRGLRTRPHPKLVQLSEGVYFGHPVTVERHKAEIEAKRKGRS